MIPLIGIQHFRNKIRICCEGNTANPIQKAFRHFSRRTIKCKEKEKRHVAVGIVKLIITMATLSLIGDLYL